MWGQLPSTCLSSWSWLRISLSFFTTYLPRKGTSWGYEHQTLARCSRLQTRPVSVQSFVWRLFSLQKETLPPPLAHPVLGKFVWQLVRCIGRIWSRSLPVQWFSLFLVRHAKTCTVLLFKLWEGVLRLTSFTYLIISADEKSRIISCTLCSR